MTALDIIILLLLGGGAIFGFMRGFVQEVLSLLAWIFAIAAIWLFYEPVAVFLAGIIGTEGGASVLGYAAVFIVTYAIGKFVASYVGGKTRSSLLGPIDRVLGFGFGALKGLAMATAGFMLLTIGYETLYSNQERPDWMTQSRTYTLLNATSNAVIAYVDKRRGENNIIEAEAGE